MTSQSVCVLGGTGFVGQHLAAELSAAGYRCRILARHPQRYRDLMVLPGTELRPLRLSETGALADQMAGCDVVVNLVGILNQGGGRTFHGTHVDLVGRLLDAAGVAGVPRYLHMSALHADAIEGTSRYLRTKGAGEELAHSRAGMEVTSFRPSVIFGPGDGFFNRFAALLKITPGVFPLACPNARFAPVYVGDVTKVMSSALSDTGTIGRGYDLCGPRNYSLRELVEYTAALIGRKTRVVGLPDFAARLQARIFQLLPGKPFSMDNYLSLQVDSVCKQNALLEMGIRPQSVEAVVPTYLA